MDEKNLLRLLRAANLSETKRGWRCPSDGDIAAYADHRLEGRDKERVETHLANCDFCLSQVSFLAQVDSAQLPVDVPDALLARAQALQPARERVGMTWSWRWGATAAAVASLAIVVMVSLRNPVVQPPPAQNTAKVVPAPQPPRGAGPEVPQPGTGETAIRQAAPKLLAPALTSPRPNATLARGAIDFRWKGIHEALFYELKVVSAEGDLVWEARADGTSATLPSSLSLQPVRKYFVWVEAVLAEGKTVRSESVAFNVVSNN
jgi:hypothetical protein